MVSKVNRLHSFPYDTSFATAEMRSFPCSVLRPIFFRETSLSLGSLHAPGFQEFCNLASMMALDNNMLCYAVDLDVLVLLVQEDSQLVPQR